MPDDKVGGEVTVEEIRSAMHKLKNGKTGADDGLVAEMLKTGHEELIQTIEMFSRN